MNWDQLLPWRSELSEDSTSESEVIEGDGPERVIVSREEYDQDDDLKYEVTD